MDRTSFAIKEAAAVLEVSDRTIRRLIAARKLIARSIGGVWRIPRGELCRGLGCSPPSLCAVTCTHQCELTSVGRRGPLVTNLQRRGLRQE